MCQKTKLQTVSGWKQDTFKTFVVTFLTLCKDKLLRFCACFKWLSDDYHTIEYDRKSTPSCVFDGNNSAKCSAKSSAKCGMWHCFLANLCGEISIKIFIILKDLLATFFSYQFKGKKIIWRVKINLGQHFYFWKASKKIKKNDPFPKYDLFVFEFEQSVARRTINSI